MRGRRRRGEGGSCARVGRVGSCEQVTFAFEAVRWGSVLVSSVLVFELHRAFARHFGFSLAVRAVLYFGEGLVERLLVGRGAIAVRMAVQRGRGELGRDGSHAFGS